MDENKKYWILLALSKSSKRGGDVFQLFRQRPDFLDVQIDEFLGLMEKLEKESLITRNNKLLSPTFFLSEKGKREIRDFYQPSNLKRFYRLLRHFPDLELKDRIENIEAFIFSTIFLFLSVYFIEKYPFTNVFVLLFLVGIFMTSLAISAKYLVIITYLVLEKFIFVSKSKFVDFYEDNKNKIGYVFVGIFTIAGLVILKVYFKLTNGQLFIAAILEGIFLLLLNAKKINEYFKTRKLKVKRGFE